jgi:hypothetical protein
MSACFSTFGRAGTWHDFPKAVTNPVVVITMNSEEVVDALAAAGCARPMGTEIGCCMVWCAGPSNAVFLVSDEGDVFKMPMVEAIGRNVKVNM